jgi:hypothetical protein
MRQLHLLKPSMSEKLTPRRSFHPETQALIVGWIYGVCFGIVTVLIWRAVVCG